MKDYIGKGWGRILRQNDLSDFDAIWNLDVGWFEEPNERRGGWSGVSRVNLKEKDNESVGVFLKRQVNHNTKGWQSPIKGIPTFYREFQNILRFVEHGVATVEPVFFSSRDKQGESQSILVTKELKGFESLGAAIYSRNGILMRDRVQREGMMKALADEMRKMHFYHFQHNCLYDKHIFLRLTENNWEVKFIDLEKLRRAFFKKSAMLRDLYTLTRHISGWRRSDKLKFLKMYMQEDKLSSESKLIWREIHNRMKAKNKL